jgi:hypothetical protein
MERAKAFFIVCAGTFLIALAYHMGVMSALAQAPGNPVVTGTNVAVVTANGDVFAVAGNAGA